MSGVIRSVTELESTYSTARAPENDSVLVPNSQPGQSLYWAHVLILVASFGWLFWGNLQRLWQWTNPTSGDPNWGHAIFIPFISVAYLLEHRQRLREVCPQPTGAGLGVILLGIISFCGGIGIQSSFAEVGVYSQDVAMLGVLFGCVLAIFGWGMVRAALFPMAYLLCALPWPPYIHDLLTVPLQHVAATLSVRILQLTGLNVEQAGNTIHILSGSGLDRALNVAEACSGMRSLITFVSLGLAVAFLSRRPMWQKIIISLAAPPIAIACNTLRIVGEGLLDHYVSRNLSEGFAHSTVGLVLLLPGLGLFFLVGWLLDRLVVANDVPGNARRASMDNDLARKKPLPRNRMDQHFALQRMYAIVVIILVTAAFSLAGTSHLLALHFQKLPVPLVRSLTTIPADLGPWIQCGGNRSIDDDIQQTLGTTQYVFRDYVDTRAVGQDAVDFLRLDPSGAKQLLREIGSSHPEAVVRLAVTYYTGHVDAVIHQSERCNLAGGLATSVQSEPVTWDLGGRSLAVRIVRLLNETPSQKSSHYLAYCYRVNGSEETEAWRVRGRLMNIFEPYAWYAKIEVTTDLADSAESQRVMGDFLGRALPEIDKCLPSNRVTGPASSATSPTGLRL